MRRSRQSVDLILAAVLAPVWLISLAAHVDLVAAGRLAWWPVYVVPAVADADYPTVRAYWTDYPEEWRTLRAGDRVLAVGATSLEGAGRFDVLAAGLANADNDGVVPLRVSRAGETVDADVPLLPHNAPWRTVPLTVGLGLAAFFALVRGRGRRSTRRFALGALSYSFVWLLQFGGPPLQSALGLVLFAVAGSVFLPLTLAAAFEIPEQILPRRSPGLIVLMALFATPGLLNVSWMLDAPIDGNVAIRSVIGIYLPFTVALFAVLAYNYRRANRKGKRQLKWVALGFYLGLAPVLVTSPLMVLDPEMRWLYELSLVTTPIIPVCILIAIMRDSFLDIDRILTSALLYSLVLPLLVGTLLTGGSRLAEAMSDEVGLSENVSLWVIGILLAAIAAPVIGWARPIVERLVAVDSIRVRQALRSLRAELDPGAGPVDLLSMAGTRLADLLELERCAIYSRAGAVFVPVYTHGSLVPPVFEDGAGLTILLGAADEPADQSQWRSWVRRGALDPVERAALETMGARLLVPVRRDEELSAFVVLGEKLSGDIYEREEIALIEALGAALGSAMGSYERDLVLEEAERLRAEVSDFVPEAVLAEIERGRDLELGDVEISIMFVDIRGYTQLSLDHSAAEVFDITDDYTAMASSVIDAYGGVVVEFQGDGLMAIFGALGDADGKETAAVAAGREIYARSATRPFGRIRPAEISVGVGVGTGEAYVGSIQSRGQKVWSAMGSAVNFAARLESLTRDLKASLVVDELTYSRAGEAPPFERYEGIPIKGFAEPFAVYAIPIESEGRA